MDEVGVGGDSFCVNLAGVIAEDKADITGIRRAHDKLQKYKKKQGVLVSN